MNFVIVVDDYVRLNNREWDEIVDSGTIVLQFHPHGGAIAIKANISHTNISGGQNQRTPQFFKSDRIRTYISAWKNQIINLSTTNVEPICSTKRKRITNYLKNEEAFFQCWIGSFLATQICDLCEGKGVAASTPKNFYRRKPSMETIVETVKEWADKEK